jgi:hypothetical protein
LRGCARRDHRDRRHLKTLWIPGTLSLGKRSALIVGVGVVVASLGRATGVFSPHMYALIVAIVAATAMIMPLVFANLLCGNKV